MPEYLSKKLSLKVRLGYGIGDTAICFYWSGVGFLLLYFYTDVVGITPVFAAGEEAIAGVTSKNLISRISKRHNKVVRKIKNEEVLEDFVIKNTEPNDLVIFMGAGDISNKAISLVSKLRDGI